MDELVLKTVKPYEGLILQIVDDGQKYKILVNGETRAVEYDYNRACETLNSFIPR